MALKNCPECQKQISDTAEVCIGCGVELKKCPECGNLVRKDDLLCGSCGFQMVEEKVEEEKENISSEVGAERLLKTMDKFKDENSGIKGCFWYTHKGTSLFSFLASLAIIVWMFANVFIGNKTGDAESLVFVLGNIVPIFLAYIATTFLVFSPIGTITNAVERIHSSGRFYEYCDRNGVDLLRYTILATYIIPTRPKTRTDTTPFVLSIAKDAVYYAAHPEERKKYKIYTIIEMVFGLLVSFTLGAFSLLGLIESLIVKALGSPLSIDVAWKLPSAFIYYGIVAVFIIFGIVGYCILNKKFNNKRDAWISEQAAANTSDNTKKEEETV